MVLPFRSILLGNPASSVNQPDSIELTTALEALQSLIEAGGLADAVFFTTKTLLDADLDHAANTRAVVYSDGANNGIYLKAGASGAGSWSRIFDYLPGYQFVSAVDAGAGTANAIVATASPEVAYTDGAQMIALNIDTTNTSQTVTVAFDGGAALTVKTVSGTAPDIGTLTAGMRVLGMVSTSATEFRLLTDLNSAASASAAAASAAAAADASRLDIGTVTTSAAGASAEATITGDPGEQVLNLTLPRGEEGPAGADGLGVPAGGTTGQVLAKASATDNDTEWVEVSRDTLGVSGEVLTKSANYTVLTADRDKLIRGTAALTLTLPAEATAGNGFLIHVLGDGGAVTVNDDAASEVVTVADGASATIRTDGTAWHVQEASGGVTGELQLDSGLQVEGRVDAYPAVVANFEDTTDTLVSLTRSGTANTSNEVAILGYADDAAGTQVKTFSISEKFYQTGATNRFSVLRLNATRAIGGTGSDYLGVRIFGNECVTINGLSDTDRAQDITGAQDKTLIRDGILSAMESGTEAIHMRFVNGSTTVGGGVSRGTIATNGSGTAYNTTSDKRLKTDLGALSYADARAILDLVQMHRFAWNGLSGSEGVEDIGAFAQDLHEIYPAAVTPGQGQPGEPGFLPWSTDLAKLMPLVVSCLQSVMNKQDDFEARLLRLEGDG